MTLNDSEFNFRKSPECILKCILKKVRQRIYSENSIQLPDHSIWSRGPDQIHLSGNRPLCND